MSLTDNLASTEEASEKRSWRAIRVSQIPSSIKKVEFSDILNSLNEDGVRNVLGWSYCPDATTCYEEKFNVATVVFRKTPPWIPNSGYGTWETKSATFAIDINFLGLTPLSSPIRGDITVDIIAVTGLAGHAFGSWRSRTQPSMWLRDFLPDMVPKARIMIYGYDTRLDGSNSYASIIDLAKGFLQEVKTVREAPDAAQRPLIFIGHSLGGLVIKQALVEAARGNKSDQQVFNSTYGLIFFGIPSRGLAIESLRTMVKEQPNRDLIEYLGSSSVFLAHLHNEFYREFTFDDSQVISIFETRTTPTVEVCKCYVMQAWVALINHQWRDGSWQRTGPEVVMVPQSSAIHHSQHDNVHNAWSINSNHSDMVKFSSRFDPNYKVVQGRIREMVASAPEVIRRRIERISRNTGGEDRLSYRIPPQLPYAKNHKFTGRARELEAMRNLLWPANTSGIHQRRLLLHGLGGIGKTQLTIEYAHKYRDDFTSIWWVNCTTKTTCSQSFLRIATNLVTFYSASLDHEKVAQNLNLVGVLDVNGQLSTDEQHTERIVQAVKRWFTPPENPNWLLILDNLDDPTVWDPNIIPSSCHGTVIVSSRRSDWTQFPLLEVAELEQQDGLLLLLKCARLDNSCSAEGKLSILSLLTMTFADWYTDNISATELAKKLDYFPLALDQAGSYMAIRNMLPGKYLKIYENNFARVFQERSHDSPYPNSVFTTWNISFEAIKTQSPKAAELLLLCSFLSNEDIWDGMLRRGLGLREDDINLDDQLSLLFSYSLAKRKGTPDSLYIHSVVHQWAREYLPFNKQRENAKKAIVLVGRAVECSRSRKIHHWAIEARILIHTSTICENYRKYLEHDIGTRDDIIMLHYMNWISLSWMRQRRWKEAVELGMQVVEARKGVLGLDHPETLTSMHILASAIFEQGRWKEAEELGVQVVEASKRVLGHDHPDTLISMSNLASAIFELGRWEEAEVLEVQVVEARKRVLGQDHPDTLNSMNHLARIHKLQGRINETTGAMALPSALPSNRIGTDSRETKRLKRSET
ncbi:hypothetical protein K440DRAFT_658315 [Wilcoxina mikolae CBS 423.85]|nr:hypothetical protein K440DRAFT_658315 [Wilcoxina mikolae CBS 423.85]